MLDITNGEVFTDGLDTGSVATYTCNDGYLLFGDKTRTCRDGMWSGTEPVCVLNACGPLSDPANGNVTVSGLASGSTATYSCDSGYMLSGTGTRTCQNLQWTGEAPICIGMNNLLLKLVPGRYT